MEGQGLGNQKLPSIKIFGIGEELFYQELGITLAFFGTRSGIWDWEVIIYGCGGSNMAPGGKGLRGSIVADI